MRLRVLLFGQARELAGAGELVLELDEDATVAHAIEGLARDHPPMEPLLARCSFALDRVYASREERVGATSELAVIPPIGGG